MPTLANMVDETLLALAGYTVDSEALTVLTADVDASALTLPVEDSRQVSAGVVEVGDELVYVRGLDEDGAAKVLTGQRGHRGTAAAPHTAGTLVRNHPRFPRKAVADTLNDVIEQSWPDLFAVVKVDLTANGAQTTYDLPDTVLSVLTVEWAITGPSREWVPVKHWRFTPGTAGVPPKVTIGDCVTPGRTVRLLTTANATRLGLADEFTTCGLQASCRDLVVFGACSRLIGNVEPGRLVSQSVQAAMQPGDPAGANISAAKWFYTLYSRRLDEERASLLQQYPIRLRGSVR